MTTPPVKKRGVPVTGWLLFLGLVVGSLSASPWGAVPLNGTAASLAVASPATASPIDREGVFRVLAANIAHYRSVFEQGQAIIGDTQYANGEEGLVGMEDPNSAAARFRDYRQNPNPALDMTFLDAFRRADKAFTVRHEPQAIRDWLDHMSFMHDDLDRWIHVAVDYQISTKSQTDLDDAAATVRHDLADAEDDARAVQRD